MSTALDGKGVGSGLARLQAVGGLGLGKSQTGSPLAPLDFAQNQYLHTHYAFTTRIQESRATMAIVTTLEATACAY